MFRFIFVQIVISHLKVGVFFAVHDSFIFRYSARTDLIFGFKNSQTRSE